MRNAVKAWLIAEGVSSVKRNNPWNLHQGAACGGDNDRGKFCPRSALPGQIGVVNVAPGDKNVAVFKTLDAGVAANANNLVRLQNSGYGYDRVIAAARSGNPQAFLNALARSSWSAGKYGTKNGGANKLILIYNNLPGTANLNAHSYSGAGAIPSSNDTRHNSGGTATAARLGAWNNIVSFPTDHVITVADVDKMIAALSDAGYFNGPGGSDAKARARAVLLTAVGKKWNRQLQVALQAQFGEAAKQAGGLDAFLGGATGLIGKLTDPGTWARILALGVGVALVAYGGKNVYQATA